VINPVKYLKMKRIYIAGAYSADNVLDVFHNIRNGIEMSSHILRLGFAPFCPWLDYHYVLEDNFRVLTVQDFYEYSLAWLEVSDALLILKDYEHSKGTLAEIEFAKEKNIPVFYDVDELLNFFNSNLSD